MTERELKDKVLLAVNNRQDRLNVDFATFCKEEGIEFKSKEQQGRILKSLKESGYINAILYEGGGGHILTITSFGVEYVEDIIANSLKETDRLIKEDKIRLDLEEPRIEDNGDQHNDSDSSRPPTLFEAKENFEIIKDESVPPCFGVEKLAECFVKQLDTTSEASTNNVCMVGIFAPWGRGKSYFFKMVKEKIETRNKQKNSTDIIYDVVEFNAWKYQETPAIWAYLFETIYKYKRGSPYIRNGCFRFWYTLKRNWRSIIGEIILFFMPLAVVLLTQQDCDWIKGTLGGGAIGLIVNFLFKHYNSAISFIRRFSKGRSFSNEMGIQAEIEKELTSLLKCWIGKKHTEKRKIILYVDDIDRCSETKMVSIIDSLRTVLENEDIRKRLIVICSVDHNKLMSGVEYKYKELFSKDEEKDELKKIAIEQLDKIFLTGLSLSRLDIEQQIEFLAKIADIKSTSDKNEQQVPYSPNRHVNSLYAVKVGDENPDKIDTSKIYSMLSEYIRNSKSKLTPRKIRVIYYRMLLANNIISSGGDGTLFSGDIAEAIFDLSCGNKCKLASDNIFYDVVEMVVPY